MSAGNFKGWGYTLLGERMYSIVINCSACLMDEDWMESPSGAWITVMEWLVSPKSQQLVIWPDPKRPGSMWIVYLTGVPCSDHC